MGQGCLKGETPLPALAHIRWLYRHPFTRGRRLAACAGWLWWQLASRLLGRRHFRWVDGLRLAARPGLHGATANVGIGLAEPDTMGFLLHYLRPGDLVIDVGANAGSYSLLAAARGARVIAVEPNPLPRGFLRRSLALNGLSAAIAEAAVSDRPGTLRMDLAGDATGHVVPAGGEPIVATTLDALAGGDSPALVKIDVEGHEAAVIAGGLAALSRAAAAIIETWGDAALAQRLAALGLRPFHYDPLRRQLAPAAEGSPAQSLLFLRDPGAARARVAGGRPFRLHRRRY